MRLKRVVDVDEFEKLERESDAREERIRELDADLSDLIDQRNVALDAIAHERAENAKLREVAEDLLRNVSAECPNHYLVAARQALAGEEEG